MMEERKKTERVFNRQFERMKKELLLFGLPKPYLAVISKYWDFAREDIEAVTIEKEDEGNEKGFVDIF